MCIPLHTSNVKNMSLYTPTYIQCKEFSLGGSAPLSISHTKPLTGTCCELTYAVINLIHEVIAEMFCTVRGLESIRAPLSSTGLDSAHRYS